MRTIIEKHLHALVSLGPRPVGSSANREAARYIEKSFRESGWNVELQQYPCTDWEAQESSLLVGEDLFQVLPNPCSPECELEGPLLALSDRQTLDSTDLAGKVLVLAGELTSEVWLPNAFKAYHAPEQQSMLERILNGKPAAVVTVQPAFGKTEPILKDEEFPLPSLSVSPETGRRLFQRSGEEAHLRLRCKRSPGTACNLVARKPNAKILICAHYDTVPGSPGAWDNASGVAALLALARELEECEFVAFDGEDLDTKGDETFLRHLGFPYLGMGETPQAALPFSLVLNLDGLGQVLGNNTFASFHLPPEWSRRFEGLAREHGLSIVEPWPMSNHFTFVSYGVPAIALSSTGLSDLSHRPHDTLEWVDPAKIAAAAAFVRKLVRSITSASGGGR